MSTSTVFAILMISTALTAAPKPPSNGRCPVLGNPVADRNQSVEVRGRRYYICCDDCAKQLAADPDRFLEQDGTPKNINSSAPHQPIRDSY